MRRRVAVNEALKARYHHGLWNRYFLSNLNTRLALPWTHLFIALRLRPNAISTLSFLVSLAGMALIAFLPSPAWMPMLGGGLLMLGLIWDHSDGQVARLTGKGTPGGGLYDTILDRWIEFGWVAALGVGLYEGAGRTAYTYPTWLVLLVVAWAAHSTLYVRWANIQKDIYLLRRELREGTRRHSAPGVLKVKPEVPRERSAIPDVRMLYVPFAFNRDVTLWMLFLLPLLPAWILGLAVFAFLHSLRGVEKNWYTFRDLKRREAPAMVAGLLDPDYHK